MVKNFLPAKISSAVDLAFSTKKCSKILSPSNESDYQVQTLESAATVIICDKTRSSYIEYINVVHAEEALA